LITQQQTTMLDDDLDRSGTTDSRDLHVLVMSPDAFISLPLPNDGFVDVGRSAKCSVRLDDPLASREHARLHVGAEADGVVLAIEDLDSANGTRVRDKFVSPRLPIAFLVGEAITIGSTVLMVQQSRSVLGSRRLWSHAYFESRLEDRCTGALAGASFAIARLHLTDKIPWPKVVPILVRNIGAPHFFAAYGPRDYEVLFVEVSAAEVAQQMKSLSEDLRRSGIDSRHGLVWYPEDGRSADALLARANALVKRDVATGVPAAASEGDVPNGAGMESLLALAKRAASRNISVLILGETGAGKDVLARSIHKLSGRKGDFVALNCAGLATTLIESELFGHEKGAFSGAIAAKLGLLEAANGGTVFLDEIGEMPLPLQTRLLRALDAREVLPVGAVRPRPIDVRFLAATNRDLEADVRTGAFRQDLFYRLNTLILAIPPLRDRTAEIPALVETFIARSCLEWGRDVVPAVSPAAIDHMIHYGWPGNIRELKNAIERALLLCDGTEILPEHLPLDKTRTPFRAPPDEPVRTQRQPVYKAVAGPGVDDNPPPDARVAGTAAAAGSAGSGRWRRDPEKIAERERIVAALDANAWSQTRAAKHLAMPRRTFVSKLEYYGIPRPQKTRLPLADA
jgi:two-component system response regulator AtoC